jgi:hypothetical protein
MTPPRIVQIELPPNLDELPAFARGEMMKALEAALFGVLPTPKDSLDERDEAIRDALALYTGKPSRRAKDLALDWSSYVANGWQRERDLIEVVGASEERRALHRLTKLNGGRARGWQQIYNIGDGHRHSTF